MIALATSSGTNPPFLATWLMDYVCILLFWFTIPRYFTELTFRVFILADSNSVDLAEKNKGSLDMVIPKFGDRNVFTFLGVARDGQPIFFQI